MKFNEKVIKAKLETNTSKYAIERKIFIKTIEKIRDQMVEVWSKDVHLNTSQNIKYRDQIINEIKSAFEKLIKQPDNSKLLYFLDSRLYNKILSIINLAEQDGFLERDIALKTYNLISKIQEKFSNLLEERIIELGKYSDYFSLENSKTNNVLKLEQNIVREFTFNLDHLLKILFENKNINEATLIEDIVKINETLHHELSKESVDLELVHHQTAKKLEEIFLETALSGIVKENFDPKVVYQVFEEYKYFFEKIAEIKKKELKN